MRRSLTLEYWRDENAFVGRLLEVPGVFSQGKTLEDLEDNIRDAFELVLAEQYSTTAPEGTQRKEIEV
jgi:predicted RNase H-like HicB family nuclease